MSVRHLLPLAGIILLAAGLAAAAEPPRSDPAAPPAQEVRERYLALLEEGQAHLVRRDPERAIATFRDAESLVPSAAEGAYRLAGALAGAGRGDDATRALARAVLSGFEDARRMEFDGALRALRGDPRFRVAVRMAEANAERVVTGNAEGPDPAGVESFESLEALHRHFDLLEAGIGGWRPLLTPGEFERLRWTTLDARRAGLTRFAQEHRKEDVAAQAELDLIRLLLRYRDPIRGWELERALRRCEEFVARRPGHALLPRAEWLSLHVRRKAVPGIGFPPDRQKATATLRTEIEAFVSRAGEKQWPEGGLALLDLVALEAGSPDGDPSGPLARLREGYAGVEPVWAFAREEEAALLLRFSGLPEFEATDLDGRPRGREALLGRVVLLDFWATWCAPCLEQFPDLARIHRGLAGDGRFLLLGISLDAAEDLDAEAFARFLADQGVSWPQIRDGLGDESPLARAFGVASVPFQVLVAPDGSLIEAGPRVDESRIRAALAEEP